MSEFTSSTVTKKFDKYGSAVSFGATDRISSEKAEAINCTTFEEPERYKVMN